MNKELIETVESLGGTALMGGILIQFSDTAFEQALKKIYEAGVEAERERCAKLRDELHFYHFDKASSVGKAELVACVEQGLDDYAKLIRTGSV